MSESDRAHEPLQIATRASRRALIAGALGGVAAWAAGAVSRVTPTRAADGDAVLVGAARTGAGITSISNTANNNTVFMATSQAAGTALWGESGSGEGVHGESSTGNAVAANAGQGRAVHANTNGAAAVWGQTDGDFEAAVVGWSNAGAMTGVMGWTGNTNPPSPHANTGVFGGGTSSNVRGVHGFSSTGQGIRGETEGGAALFGLAEGGYAVRGSGRVRFDRVSGVASITAGSTSKVVNPGVNVTAASFMLLTPKANLGGRDIWFTTNATTNKFTIRMSSARGSATKIAWLLVG
jgi:hypothetical protein